MQCTARAATGFQFRVEPRPEADRADTIAAMHRGPGRERRGARRLHRLEAHARAEMHAWVAVDEQKYTLLTLLLEHLGMRPAAARGQAPVHLADVVAGLVGAR